MARQVRCLAAHSKALEVNTARASLQRWPSSLLDDMWARFEEPRETNRWEAPLCRVEPLEWISAGDDESEVGPTHTLPRTPEEVRAFLGRFLSVGLRQVQQGDDSGPGRVGTAGSSVMRGAFKDESSDYVDCSTVHELGQISQIIIDAVVDMQRVSLPGDALLIPVASAKLALPRVVGLAELRRIRREFLAISQHTHCGATLPISVEDGALRAGILCSSRALASRDIANLFVEFLQSRLTATSRGNVVALASVRSPSTSSE